MFIYYNINVHTEGRVGNKLNTLIVYATKHGCSETCAKILSQKLTGNVDLYNLKEERAPILATYEQVIIGGSIYMGKIQKEVHDYCTKNMNLLLDKKIGLFVCGMLFERANEELNHSFPNELLTRAIAKEFFGGEFKFNRMNFFDRLVVEKVAKVNNDLSQILEENITRFIELMNNGC